ncbi:cobalamin adenosyltransferase [Rhodospirillum rubrum]|uniref:GlcG/HbpS family heme-binding protein n=1 Tax=Rhodospirillum rubrum TaxID=1085 RepID=UPI0019086E6E|nr:heme-binding protein [Rhodospirillum rubrum]MBK1664605.1 cobalamin adenosyltransferase [Rhodospirillum rubrum]MBK1677244.1 cobalamin adenosyltransferase [Rhodospirillum rubrum]
MNASAQDIDRISIAVRTVLAELGQTPTALGPLGLKDAQRLAALAAIKATEIAVPMVIAVADVSGGLILVHRMDGALPASLDIAINKAFTAAVFRTATHDLGALAQPGQPLYGIQSTNQGRVVIFGGGFPCRRGGSLAGAIGISGGSVEEDMQVASYALRIFLEESGLCPEGEK